MISLKKTLLAVGVLMMTAQSAHAGRFGYAGADGSFGTDGRDGRSPVPSSIRAEGQAIRLDLPGENGEAGSYAQNGENANSCYQPMVRDNLYGASGGNGGRGGNGGSGGHGGDATIVYTDRAQLANILIRSPGGRGARGGESGQGGYGCICSNRSWQVRTCRRNPNGGPPICSISYYSCYNGLHGDSPMGGSYGRDGRAGQVLLVHSSKQITQDAPALSGTVAGFLNGGSRVVTRNLYQAVPNVSQLLAPGSDVDPMGSEFVRLKTVPVSFVWSAPQAVQNFGQTGVNLRLNEQGELDVSFNGDLWLDAAIARDIGGTDQARVDIRAAYRPDEIGNLSFSYIAGQGNSMVAQIDDLNRLPTDVPVTFKVFYETKPIAIWKDRWSGDVPSTLVQKVGNQYQIAVGQLPIGNEWLTAGKIRITVTAEFLMGGQSKSVQVVRIIK